MGGSDAALIVTHEDHITGNAAMHETSVTVRPVAAVEEVTA